ncbi:MAG: hypothetical protein WCG93_02360 [Paludibacter sp.]
MANNSNQTGALLALAIILGVVFYGLSFFGSEMEQTNLLASFGQLSKSSAEKSLFETPKTIASDLSTTETRSDLSGITLPVSKMKGTSGGNYAQTSSPDFPSTGIEQADVQNRDGSSVTHTASIINSARSNSQMLAFGNTGAEYISNPQNPTKSDINALLLLDTHAAEAAMSSQQASKRATPSLAAKTTSATASLSTKSAAKIIVNPGEPGPSLPVGDGTLILLLMMLIYVTLQFHKQNRTSLTAVLK